MKGTYCLVIRMDRPRSIAVGRLGTISFRPGYYVYVGSALAGLEARIGRHLSIRKRKHWHIDYLLEHGEIAGIRRIVSPERLECIIARRVGKLSESPVRGFGSSDCSCETHLYYFAKNPLSIPGFEGIWPAQSSRS
jgi:sugar fermentation stimulation protein A